MRVFMPVCACLSFLQLVHLQPVAKNKRFVNCEQQQQQQQLIPENAYTQLNLIYAAS